MRGAEVGRAGIGAGGGTADRAPTEETGVAADVGGAANIASSSWKRSPPMPGPVGVDRGQATAGGGEGGWIVTGARRIAEPGDQLGSDGFDRLVEEGPDVASAFLERVEQGDAGRPVAARRDDR